MLEITPGIQIDERDLHFDFIHSAGPGGQNVNKVATAAQLRYDVRASSLPDSVKDRLVQLGGKRVNQEGVLIIEAKRFRTQEQNREDALRRLADLLKGAFKEPKPRRIPQPSRAARRARIVDKKRRGEIKKLRQSPPVD
jgi:ribosome-associated protein